VLLLTIANQEDMMSRSRSTSRRRRRRSKWRTMRSRSRRKSSRRTRFFLGHKGRKIYIKGVHELFSRSIEASIRLSWCSLKTVFKLNTSKTTMKLELWMSALHSPIPLSAFTSSLDHATIGNSVWTSIDENIEAVYVNYDFADL
jgi:hypothetical protein